MSAKIETSGKLADGPLPTILHALFVAKATGVVKLETRVGQHALYLRDGYPVSVTLPGSAELLGKVLLEMGILDDASHRLSMSQPPPKGKRYGEMLVEQRLVTPDQIRLALKAQVRRKLHRLFFLNDGSWVFQSGPHTQGMQGPESLRVHPYRAIYHGVRSAWPADQLQGALFLLEGKAIKAKITADEAARYGLGPDDGRVAELLRKGYWTLPDLADAAGLPPQPVHALVYSFYITDGLDIQLADSVPRLKRKAEASSGESVATARVPSGSFIAPQPTTPKAIYQPGAVPVPPVGGQTPPQGTARSPSGSNQPIVGRSPSGSNQPIMGRSPSGTHQGMPRSPSGIHQIPGRSPSGTAYPQLPGGGIDIPAVRRQIEVKSKVVEAETLFEVLGLEVTAGREDVKNAYFEAARRFHPDRLTSLGLESLRSDVEKIFRRVSEAYTTLFDDAQRETYRQELAKPRSGQDADAHAKAMKMLEAEMAFRRGEILVRKNDFAGALVEMEAAVLNNPTEGEHLAYLAWCKLCLGQLSHTVARPLFQEAVKLTPNCARGYYFLGLCFKEENDIDKAYNAFRKARDLDPRMLDAEREMRLINMRKEKGAKSGLLSKFLNKK